MPKVTLQSLFCSRTDLSFHLQLLPGEKKQQRMEGRGGEEKGNCIKLQTGSVSSQSLRIYFGI